MQNWSNPPEIRQKLAVRQKYFLPARRLSNPPEFCKSGRENRHLATLWTVTAAVVVLLLLLLLHLPVPDGAVLHSTELPVLQLLLLDLQLNWVIVSKWLGGSGQRALIARIIEAEKEKKKRKKERKKEKRTSRKEKKIRKSSKVEEVKWARVSLEGVASAEEKSGQRVSEEEWRPLSASPKDQGPKMKIKSTNCSRKQSYFVPFRPWATVKNERKSFVT
jgi:hypothetical protein